MTAEVDSITGAKVFPQFKPPLTHRLAIPENSHFQTLE